MTYRLCVLALLAACGGGSSDPMNGPDAGDVPGSDGPTGMPPSGLLFSAYKDTGINMDWNANVISTSVSGARVPLATDLAANGAKAITLAFATGECGSETWGGVDGATIASANVPLFVEKDIGYIVSTGGSAGSFTCGTDAGFESFVARWRSANLIGFDFDIEAGQTQAVIGDLITRIKAAHAASPSLRFSLTLATLANNAGASTAVSLGAGAQDAFNVYGDWTMTAVKNTLGFSGEASTWPAYLTINLMVMDYGAPSQGVCVVSGGACEMGQSAIQAAYNLHDVFGVPYANIELTPMIGGNDSVDEKFTVASADAVTAFAIDRQLAGAHYWSYDRDTDCPSGPASPTCNTLGGVGAHGFLERFLAGGLR
jgi:hypothetical protein